MAEGVKQWAFQWYIQTQDELKRTKCEIPCR